MMSRARFLVLAGCLAVSSLALAPLVNAAGPDGVLDSRGWEMVSPVEKNGGEVAAPGGEGAGVLQAAAAGGMVAFASEASFGEAAGAPPISQYLATRGGAGWLTENVTPALLSGTYDGDPYLLFSEDLTRAILSGGWACRDGGEECEAENPPLGPGGPAGYRNAYLAEGATYTPLITEANFGALPPEAKEFHLSIDGASPDLDHVVFSSAGDLYEWSEGSIAQVGAAGATLAAAGIGSGAVSENGSRVYYTEGADLHLREGVTDKLVCEACAFGAASTNGATAFYAKAEQLFSYDAPGSSSSAALTSGVKAIVGTSPDGAYLFFVKTDGLYRWHSGTATKIASATPAQLPPQTGRAAVAAGGNRFFFTAGNALLPLSDSNGRKDAYEWEAGGTGNCSKSPGCLGLLSSGRSGEGSFVAASASGADAYFLTATSLLPADTGVMDVYDARAGGGYPEPQPGIECVGDDCQGPPFVPQDPAPATSVVSGPADPPLSFSKTKKCPKGKRRVVRKGKVRCVAKRHHHHKRGAR